MTFPVQIMAVCLAFIAIAYASALLWLRRGLKFLPAGENRQDYRVSVLIAARNEEKNIEACIRAVAAQTYPAERFEIIVANDQSTDATEQIVRRLQPEVPQLRLANVGETGQAVSPKKRALRLAIGQARGEIIVTTDADCRPPSTWLQSLIGHFEPQVGLVAGFNPYAISRENSGLLGRSLALDYFSMAAVAATTAAIGFPISCSGGNLAYRKQLHEEVNGQDGLDQWVSGDDDLFLGKVRDQTQWQIRYAASLEAHVPTSPPRSPAEFIQQRLRYASKVMRYSPAVIAVLAVIYIFNAFLVFGLPVSAIAHDFFPFWLMALSIKSLAEYFFLHAAARAFSFRFRLSDYFVTALWHPPYVIVASLLAQFTKFTWKGRKHTKTMRYPRPTAKKI